LPDLLTSLGHDLVKSFDPQYQETSKPRCAIRIWKTLGSKNAGGGLVLAFNSTQLIMQARSFGAILFSFDTELDGADASHRGDDLGDDTALAVAGRFELVGEIVLVPASSSSMRR
jgi:hypothetical protein